MVENREVIESSRPLCQLKNVVKIYQSGETVCPINGVDLKCHPGDFISIEGPSGIGKSTLLYLAGGLLQADSGEVVVDSIDLKSISDHDLTILRATKIGFIFQETNLFKALTVGENMAFALKMTNKYLKNKLSKADISHKAEVYLERLGLGDRRDFLPHQLSVGQRRRLVAAGALIKEPLLVLADEPTNDLDDFWARQVMDLLHAVTARGGAVVMVTHNHYWAEQANCRYALNHGLLVSKQSG